MTTSQMLLSLALMLSSWYQLSTQDTLLFVATPGGGSVNAGLYGALITDSKGRLRKDTQYDFKFGYHCSQDSGAIDHELPLQSVAYDDVTGHVLLQRKEEIHRDLVTLYEGHVCHNGGGCRRNKHAARVLFENVHFRYQKPKAFGYHNRTIYFMMQETRGTESDEKHNVIELRRFTGCHDKYPVTSYKRFELERCSEKLATLVDERRGQPLFEPMAGLHLSLIDHELYAFVILEELIMRDGHISDIAVNLYAMNLGNHHTDNMPLHLHRELIGHATYRRYIMTQLGNVDYMDDKLCWTALDRVLCADFFAPRQELRRVRYIVPPGGASNVVCKGEERYANITTGVAIADVTNDEVSLFFGCIVNGKGIGGSGFAYMRHWEFEAEPVLRPFGNISSGLLSGQMFLSHKCKYVQNPSEFSKDHEYDLQSDQGAENVQGVHSGATIRRTGCTVVVVLYVYRNLLFG